MEKVWKNKLASDGRRSAVWDHTAPPSLKGHKKEARHGLSQSPSPSRKQRRTRQRPATCPPGARAKLDKRRNAQVDANAPMIWYCGTRDSDVSAAVERISADYAAGRSRNFHHNMKQQWTQTSVSSTVRGQSRMQAQYIAEGVQSLKNLESAVVKASFTFRALPRGSIPESASQQRKRSSGGDTGTYAESKHLRRKVDEFPEMAFIKRALAEGLARRQTSHCDLYDRYASALTAALQCAQKHIDKIKGVIPDRNGRIDVQVALHAACLSSDHLRSVFLAHFSARGDGTVDFKELIGRINFQPGSCSDLERDAWAPHATPRFRALKAVFSPEEYDAYVRTLGSALSKIYTGITWSGAASSRGIYRLFHSMDTGVNSVAREVGTWYDGKVAKLRSNGTCDIEYAEGDAEMRVHRHHLRLPMPPGSPRRTEIKIGDLVKVHRAGDWVRGKISKVHSGGFFDVTVLRGGFTIPKVRRQFVRGLSNTLDDHEEIDLNVGDSVEVQHREKTSKTYRLASDGRLSRAELKRGLGKLGIDLGADEADVIFDHFDDSGDGHADLRELCDTLLDVGPSAAAVRATKRWLRAIQSASVHSDEKTWEKHMDSRSGMPFWYCDVTGERTWEKPSGVKREDQDTAVAENAARHAAMRARLAEEIDRAEKDIDAQAADMGVKVPVIALAEADLSALPDCLGAFTSARILWAPCNRIASVPSSISKLSSTVRTQPVGKLSVHIAKGNKFAPFAPRFRFVRQQAVCCTARCICWYGRSCCVKLGRQLPRIDILLDGSP